MLTCPTCQLMFVDYVAGSLENPLRCQFEQHLQECANCQLALKSYQTTISLARELPPLTPPPSILERMKEALNKSVPAPSPTNPTVPKG